MTDISKDDPPEGEGDKPEAGSSGTAPWQPATDAGRPEPSSPTNGSKTGAAKKGDAAKASASPRRPAPTGEETLRRRPESIPAEEPQPEPEGETAPEPEASETFAGERIAKAIARAGLASRRDAEAMILAGRVSVNGEIIASPALNVTDEDRIAVDGEPMPTRERTRLWIFHKPRGLVTTARDPEGRQTVFEVLPEDMPRVVAVGRLDINTEGLLLLTNDGGLAKVIAHPDTGWLRRYRVRAHGDTDQAQLDRLAKGVTIDGMEYGPVEATLDRVQGDNLWLTLGLREGKNREVKRILEHLGLRVNRLIRLSFGPFQLGDLEVGLVEEVRTRVLKDQLGKTLSEQAGVDFESPVRDPIAPFGGPAKPARTESAPAKGQARRDAARPAPQRVATGGTGSGPRKSVWRADADEMPTYRPGRAPRRGADPRESQAAAAERGRERVGAIKAGDRRVLVERLSPRPVEPVREEAPRRRFAKSGGTGAPEGARPFRSRDGDEGRPARARPFSQGEGGPNQRGERSSGPRREGGGPPRGRGGERGEFGGGRSGGERRGGAREDGGFADRVPRSRPDGGEGDRGRSRPAAREFGDRPAGGGRPGGAGARGPRPGGSQGAGKPGGFKPGGSRGGSKTGGGFKSGGGFKAGGPKGGGSGGAGFRGDGPRGGGPKGGGPKGGGRPPRSGR